VSGALDRLRGVVHPDILERTERISRRLTELGVPHALIGGLAVGVHGHPRLTKDVDFIVGFQAFEPSTPFLVYRPELAEVARVGFSDLMAIPPGCPWLVEEVSLGEAVPVISLPGLILMKLIAFRGQDQADVEALLRDDETRLADVSDYLAERAPDLLIRLGQVLSVAHRY
jgi:hypothetical protein